MFKKGDVVSYKGKYNGLNIDFTGRVVDTYRHITIYGKDNIYGVRIIKVNPDCPKLDIVKKEDRESPSFLMSKRARWIARYKKDPQKTYAKIEQKKKNRVREFFSDIYKNTVPKLDFKFDNSVNYKEYKISVNAYDKVIKKHRRGGMYLAFKHYKDFFPEIRQFV